jgi:hypothetical protein
VRPRGRPERVAAGVTAVCRFRITPSLPPASIACRTIMSAFGFEAQSCNCRSAILACSSGKVIFASSLSRPRRSSVGRVASRAGRSSVTRSSFSMRPERLCQAGGFGRSGVRVRAMSANVAAAVAAFEQGAGGEHVEPRPRIAVHRLTQLDRPVVAPLDLGLGRRTHNRQRYRTSDGP